MARINHSNKSKSKISSQKPTKIFIETIAMIIAQLKLNNECAAFGGRLPGGGLGGLGGLLFGSNSSVGISLTDVEFTAS
jgi:hypothetical protein